jgi:glycosyltransferase involved in cell wall biosynthesis
MISIIMGVRNGGNRFVEAVKSIENQTYTDWEFVICDDGSTDDTYERLLQYAFGKSRFKIIRNKTNLGLAATLNHCLEHCNGEYIARMDDDDFSYPDRFKKQVEYLELHQEIAFVSSNADIFNGKEIVSQRTLLPNPTKKDLVYGSRFIHPATMFRASALKSVGGYRVCKDTIRGQDYDLFMRLYGAGYLGANITEPLFRYTEDKANFKRRKFKARIGEMKIRIYGYKAMKVLHWAFPFAFKPLIAWIVTFFKRR